MSSEIAEKEYSCSVKSVAKELLGEFFPPDCIKSLWRIPHVEKYLSSFRKIMKEADYRDDDFSFSHKIISEFEKNVEKGTSNAIDAAPWTIAVAILTEDESIKGLSETRLRFILDLAIGIAADEYHNHYVSTKRTAAYEKDPKFKEKESEYSAKWKEISEGWEKYQDKLRQQISPTGKIERK